MKFKKNLFFFSLVLGMLVLAVNAHALGSAGCGLGSVIFKNNKWFFQILAMTTNHSTSSQFLGITFGTSNCAPGLFGDTQKQEDYIAYNLVTLEKEASQGLGDTLDGLASLMGCDQNNYSVFNLFAQKHYKDIFNTNQPNGVLNNIKSLASMDQSVFKTCPFAKI